MGFIAPAGTPVSLRDVASAAAPFAQRHSLRALEATLTSISGTDSCWAFSSGRAAMVVALTVMGRLAGPGRDRVIVPSYTCYSVPAAAVRAGLRPIVCDIDPHTLSMDLTALRRLDFRRVVAVVSSNLYGVPNDLESIETIARDSGVFMLDDAAQALGARFRARAVGGFGDAGLYSFDKGKNVPTMQGGVIVSRNTRFAAAMSEHFRGVESSAATQTLASLAKMIPYSLFLRPRLYDVVRRLPGLGLGRTVYETDYPVTRYSPTLAAVAVRLLSRLSDLNAVRIANATKVMAAVRGIPGLSLIEPLPGAEPVYLRLPVRASSRMARDRLIEAFEAAGIGATASYPRALADLPEVVAASPESPGPCEGSRAIADTIITLPTQAFCPPDFAERVRGIAQSVGV